ncbi:hypothetical protein [Streptomyces sp. KL116D]|uniref:hypothetical protein n=1 Tax=Streptomyces sp. KL116D TaxID=3045152 RepID=UPI0035586269
MRFARADGTVIGTSAQGRVRRSAEEALLGLLPRFALSGKTVLPLATGGSVAHVLARLRAAPGG